MSKLPDTFPALDTIPAAVLILPGVIAEITPHEPAPDTSPAADTPDLAAEVSSRRRQLVRVGVYAASVGLSAGLFANAAPAAAEDASGHATSAYSHSAAAPTGKLSAHQMFNRCEDNVRVVVHKAGGIDGGNGTKGPDVNTIPWVMKVAHNGNWIEGDGQLSNKGTEYGEHDPELQTSTRNGHGRVEDHGDEYLDNVITTHGQHLAPVQKIFHLMQTKFPNLKFQHEFKDYFSQWKFNRVKTWMKDVMARGLQDRVYESSAWTNVLKWVKKVYPGAYTEVIGFYENRPNIHTAKQIDANQVNLKYDGAFRPITYDGKHYATYTAAAIANGLKVSTRSDPSGAGDSPSWWAREIRANVSAIVTQGKSKAYVCNAVRHYVKGRGGFFKSDMEAGMRAAQLLGRNHD